MLLQSTCLVPLVESSPSSVSRLYLLEINIMVYYYRKKEMLMLCLRNNEVLEIEI